MKTTLLGSAPTMERLHKIIYDYWYGSSYELIRTSNPNIWEIYNKNGKTSFIVKKTKNRFRFERIDEI